MSAKGAKDVELSSDIDFIKTPAAKPSEFATGEDCGIATTNVSVSRAIGFQFFGHSFAKLLQVRSH